LAFFPLSAGANAAPQPQISVSFYVNVKYYPPARHEDEAGTE